MSVCLEIDTAVAYWINRRNPAARKNNRKLQLSSLYVKKVRLIFQEYVQISYATLDFPFVFFTLCKN